MFETSILEKALKIALSGGGEFCDIFIEKTGTNHYSMGNSKIDSIKSATVSGIGIRIIRGNSYTYACSSGVTEKGLLDLAGDISYAVVNGKKGNLGEISKLSILIENLTISGK